jgi:hypothetical protein
MPPVQVGAGSASSVRLYAVASRGELEQRVSELEGQAEALAYAATNLVAITQGLTAIVANLRAEANPAFDASLPDIEKDLRLVMSRLDEAFPGLRPSL